MLWHHRIRVQLSFGSGAHSSRRATTNNQESSVTFCSESTGSNCSGSSERFFRSKTKVSARVFCIMFVTRGEVSIRIVAVQYCTKAVDIKSRPKRRRPTTTSRFVPDICQTPQIVMRHTEGRGRERWLI